jgi:acyl carrier protein
MPPSLSFQEAATVPTVFITVHMALGPAGACRPGKRVLVHAAAGGVGLAAIQVAQAAGGAVIATAGGPGKRSLLHSLGVESVVGSRDTQFASDVAQLGGADVVLNSLTSSGMVAGSLAGLRRGGRFVEISKRDIWSPARLAQERPDVAYSLLAVDFLPAAVIQATLRAVAAQLAAGALAPLRQVAHTMGGATSALRQMTQASHVGKIVAAPRQGGAGPALPLQSYPAVAITGGGGGLGVMIVQWLAQRTGPIHAHLLSRSGRVADPAALAALAATSACVTTTMADASVAVDMEAALAGAEGPPLLGLIHASGVLEDALLDKQTAASFKRVFGPKLGPLRALAAASSRLPLAALTLFSSVSSLLGGAGQANYAAANAALDAWAHGRQAAGAAARSVQWGAWASSGMASEAVLRRLARIGQGMITAEQGLLSLAAVLRAAGATAAPALPQLAVNDFIWGTYLKAAAPPFFAEFAPAGVAADGPPPAAGSVGGAARGGAGAAKPSADPAALKGQVRSEVKAAILQVLGASIGDDEPLMSAGLDSLGSVEFANVLAAKLGARLPSTLVFDYPSVNAVTEFLAAQLAKTAAAAAAAAGVPDIEVEVVGGGAMEAYAPGRELAAGAPAGRRAVAVVAAVARPLLADGGCGGGLQGVPAGWLPDLIQRVPLQRWDLDLAEALQRDPFTLAAQVGAMLLLPLSCPASPPE